MRGESEDGLPIANIGAFAFQGTHFVLPPLTLNHRTLGWAKGNNLPSFSLTPPHPTPNLSRCSADQLSVGSPGNLANVISKPLYVDPSVVYVVDKVLGPSISQQQA